MVSGGPLDFGSTVAGTTPPVVDPQKSTFLFTISGNGGGSLKVTYSNVAPDGPSGATLTLPMNVYGSSSSSNGNSPSNVPPGTTIDLSGTGS